MSNIKRLLDELQVQLVELKELSNLQHNLATGYLNQKAGITDPDLEQHEAEHGIHPSMNCHYCVDHADIPEMEVLEETEAYD